MDGDYYKAVSCPKNNAIFDLNLSNTKFPLGNLKSFRYLVIPSEKCTFKQRPNKSELHVNIVYIIISDPDNVEWRNAIRNTWASKDYNKVIGSKFYFALGLRAMKDISIFNSLITNISQWLLKSTFITTNSFLRSFVSKFVQYVKEKNVGLILNSDLCDEITRYGDIILGDFMDSYRNLTYKHLMALHWSSVFCNSKEVDYVIKVDDDLYIDPQNTQILLQTLKINYRLPINSTKLQKNLSNLDASTLSQTSFGFKQHKNNNLSNTVNKNILICHRFGPSNTVRNAYQKWYVTPEEYSNATYPPYCLGTFIIYSLDLAAKLYQSSLVNSTFWIDDVYVTGILLDKVIREQKANVTILNWEKYIWKLLPKGSWNTRRQLQPYGKDMQLNLLIYQRNLKLLQESFNNNASSHILPIFLTFLLPREDASYNYRFAEIFAPNIRDNSWNIVIN